MNFKNIPKINNNNYLVCDNCMAIINKENFKNNIFKTQKYIETDQSDEKIIYDKGLFVTRPLIQTKIISKLKLNNNPSIIDFGSFDGKLLKTIHNNFFKIKKKAKFYGYDINKNLEKFYNKNITFIKDFNTIFKNNFDLIIFSHSFMYIDKIKSLHKILNENLNPNGKVIVQVSDLEKRPLNLTLLDQYCYPTKEFLLNFFFKKGFSFKDIINKNFKNEIILVFTKNYKKPLKNNKSISFNQIIEKINIYKNNLKIKLNKSGSAIYIFGTTLEASYTYNFIKLYYKQLKVLGFVDESFGKVNKKFNKLRIFHPSYLDKNIDIIFPYQNTSLKKQLKNKYDLNFI